ncbi:TetR/AcrR family transcriptional regulator [Mycolicibacterium sp. XJ1819]
MVASTQSPAVDVGRGERTRAVILEGSRRLFLERGYAGTTINAITDACGISRAGFYTYFKDKREVFNILGETVYHDTLAVVAEFEKLPRPVALSDVTRWVKTYFDHLDTHGAFLMAAQHSAPDDEEFKRSLAHTSTRTAWKLGQAVVGAGGHPYEAVGVSVMGLLERAWYAVQTQSVRVDKDEVAAVVAEMIHAMTPQAES